MPDSAEALLIIPTYNEAGNIQRLTWEIQEQQLGLDILVIDDHSPDGTGDLAEQLAREMPLRVIHRNGKYGIGSAHKLGLRYATEHGYRTAITMDADLAHSPRYLRHMMEKASHADVVIGSRYIEGGDSFRRGWLRPFISWAAHGLTTCVLKLPYDCTGGLRLYRVSSLKRIEWDQILSDGHAFLMESLYAIQGKGLTILEVPIVVQPRLTGESKVSLTEVLVTGKVFLRLLLQSRRQRRGGRVTMVGNPRETQMKGNSL